MKWTHEKIIEDLKAVAVRGIVSYWDAAAFAPSLPTMALRRFGSFEAACAAAGVQSASAAKPRYDVCCVEGCDRTARSVGTPYCEVHYMRLRRRGTTDRFSTAGRLPHSNGYVLVYAPNHPLTQRHTGSWEYEHRVVYYDAHGEGPFTCHWCASVVGWDSMHVDHLNDMPTDNREENLVASCPLCNQKRGRVKMTRAQRANGTLLSYDGRTLCLSEWARLLDISRSSLRWRLNAGWTIDEVLSRPRGMSGPMRKDQVRT